MSAKGLRFFSTNYNDQQFGGTITVSSSDNLKNFAFDGLSGTKWITNGESADGNAVSLEMDYGFNRTIDSLFVYDTNIDNLVLAYWNGASYTSITGSNATIIKSADKYFVFAKLNAPVTTSKVILTGSNTIIANQEKYVTQFMAFSEIGQLEYFPPFHPRFSPEQNVFKITDGRSFVIERGESFSAQVDFKSHVNQNDIDLAMTLFERKEPFFLWPCGGDVSIFVYSFKPYRFQDIFKVTHVGAYEPELTNNYYKSGLNATLNLVEVP